MKGKILVVDDDPIMVMTLKRLSNAGFEVEGAEDGYEAIEKMKEFQPDVIFSDIMMPRMDGYAFYRQLRENPDTASIPFIFLTAKSDIFEQLEGLRMGVDDYICKPVQIPHLIERTERVLEQSAKFKSNLFRADFSGNLARMTWSDIVQIVELNYKNGELVLRNAEDERVGCAYFYDGDLLNAKAGGFEGEEAFFALMSEPEGSFEFFVKNGNWSRRIGSSNAAVLLEGFRMVDETSDLLSAFSDFQVFPGSDNYSFPVQMEEKVGKERLSGFLSELEKCPTVRQLVYSGLMSPIRTGAMISLLAREKKITIEKPAGNETSDLPMESSAPMMEEGMLKLLQKIEKFRQTGLLQFYNRSPRQALFLQNGRVVHALHGKTVGKEAAVRIFRERSGTFKFFQQPVAVLQTIDSSLSDLLEEGILEKTAKDLNNGRNR